LLKIEDETS